MEIIDGSCKFKIKDKRQHHCLGEIVALISTPIYEHLLECNGQTISETDYPELVNILGTNIVPNLNGRVLQGSNTPNTFIEAGLPNITGKARIYSEYNKKNYTVKNVYTGAFYWTDALEDSREAYGTTTNMASGSNDTIRNVPFDASRCSAVYGKSSTVQPPAYTVKYYICYQS